MLELGPRDLEPRCILVDDDATDENAMDKDATDEDATDEDATDEDSTDEDVSQYSSIGRLSEKTYGIVW